MVYVKGNSHTQKSFASSYKIELTTSKVFKRCTSLRNLFGNSDLRPDNSFDHDERENNDQPWITLGQVRDDKSFSSQIFYNLAESIND